MIASAPSVGIGILNYNGEEFLKALLPELYQLTYPNYKIYVIDNKSTDNSVSLIRAYHPTINVIELDANYGFAGGYNRGLAFMHEDYYLMMNSDVEVPRSFIEPLVAMMEEDSSIAVCQPKLLALQNTELFEHAGAAGGMIDFLGYPFCRGRIFESSEKDDGQYNTAADIFWATGACNLIRSKLYWQVNGMYEYYFMHSEEIDMCWRLIAEGYKIKFCPDSYIYHLGGGTLSYKSPRKTYFNFRNNLVMCFRNSPWYINLWLMPVRLILDLIAAISFLLEDWSNCKAVLVAYKDFFKWLLTEKNKFPARKKSLLTIPCVLKTSIVWEYYIKNMKTFKQLKQSQ